MANFKLVRIFVLILLSAFVFSSCIKDEAQNTEADIVSCTVEGDLLIRNPVITNNEIRLYVNGWDDVTRVAPVFEITDGATIEPASGTVRDFTTPQTYTVTSQDGQWKKTYTVSFISEDIATNYHFENMKWYEYTNKWKPSAEPQKLFHIFYDTTIEGTDMEWGSGNAGYMITNSSAPAESYPTSQSEDGFVGKCVKLTTVSTGALGAGFGAPLAAGNLFLGTFEVNLLNMAKSTHFGQPFRKMPQALVGYYKYKAGEKYTDKKNAVVPEKKDEFDIYAVFYEVTADVPYLDGTNSLTSDNIVLLARLTDKKETDEWTRFNIPFEAVNGRKIDAQKLKDGKYNLAIIMSSSKDGANFNGAVGSTLYVDEMELFYE
ncbi:PCMD domain-containing protein [Prevotella sp. HUN102]|uniref:PCMD domain-containing protein n=1 Tax=Prevotella sp. HUN102 TaxID=1392486 RepID=UPI0004913258|nr:PCMD domain-containing protein [Prevotella sp. HUN102]